MKDQNSFRPRLRGSMRDLENKRKRILERSEQEKMLRNPAKAYVDGVRNIRKNERQNQPSNFSSKTPPLQAMGNGKISTDNLRPFVERAAEVLLEAGKRTKQTLRSPSTEASRMQMEAEEKIKEIGMVFDRNSKEILKFIKQNKKNK